MISSISALLITVISLKSFSYYEYISSVFNMKKNKFIRIFYWAIKENWKNLINRWCLIIMYKTFILLQIEYINCSWITINQMISIDAKIHHLFHVSNSEKDPWTFNCRLLLGCQMPWKRYIFIYWIILFVYFT